MELVLNLKMNGLVQPSGSSSVTMSMYDLTSFMISSRSVPHSSSSITTEILSLVVEVISLR